jgi:hypothetical protein
VETVEVQRLATTTPACEIGPFRRLGVGGSAGTSQSKKRDGGVADSGDVKNLPCANCTVVAGRIW